MGSSLLDVAGGRVPLLDVFSRITGFPYLKGLTCWGDRGRATPIEGVFIFVVVRGN